MPIRPVVHSGTGALKALWLNQNIGNRKEHVEVVRAGETQSCWFQSDEALAANSRRCVHCGGWPKLFHQIRVNTSMGVVYLTFAILPSPITVHGSLPTEASA